MGHLTGFEAYAGAYLGNVNIECGYIIPQNTASTVYWITNPSSWSGQEGLEYEYSVASVISVNTGYGILIGNRTRVTPRIGMAFSQIDGKFLGNSPDMDQATFVVSGCAGIRAEYSPIPHIGLVCTSSYGIPLKKGELADKIDVSSDLVKDWCGGFSISLGVELFF